MEPLTLLILAPFLMLGALAAVFALDLLLAFPLMYAWNYVIPGLFGLPLIGYWQSFCLLVVASMLVKSSAPPSIKSQS